MKHQAPISGVATSRDYVATAGYDSQLLLWRPSSKTVVARATHDHLVNQCAFSPDGTRLASASSDHTARLWSVPDLKLLAVLGHHEDDVEMVAFSPDGARVATACRDHRGRVFDRAGRLLATLSGHTADVISISWTADGESLISSSDDGSVRVWDPRTGLQRRIIDMRGVETDTVALGADGTIYAGDDDGEITIIRPGSAARVPAHSVGIKRLIIGDSHLVSLSYDRTLAVWEIRPNGELVLNQRTEMPTDVWPRSGAFWDQYRLVFGTFGTSYATFDLDTKEWDLTEVGQTDGINAVVCHGSAMLTVGDAGVVRLANDVITELGSLCNFLTPFAGAVLTGGQIGKVFDALSGRVIHSQRSPLNCAATFLSEGRPKAVVGTYSGEGLIFSVGHDGAPRFECTVPMHSNAIKGLAGADGVLFSVSATGAAAWHSSDDYRRIAVASRGHDRIANGCVALGSRGFASVSRDRRLRTWSAEGTLRATLNTPHTHSIKCIAASVDGRFIATGSYNGRAAVYDCVAETWVVDRRLTHWGISSIAASPTGFVAGAYDGRTYTIDV